MSKTKRPFLQVANWKMNKTIREAQAFVSEFLKIKMDATEEIWFAVPFTAIHAVSQMLTPPYRVGAQNMNDVSSGAYTGEIAATMIQEAGGSFVILGHSERRKYFHEDDAFINKKVVKAIESSLKPILCIGESFEEREGGNSESVLENQIKNGLKDVSKEAMSSCIIAYEPIWAIGTGKTATTEIVEETIRCIRTVLGKLYDEETSENIAILYGGSVSEKTAENLSKTPGVDGFLIGTASLDVGTFAKIIALCNNMGE